MAATLCGCRFGARSGWSRDWNGFSETDLIQDFCMSRAFLIKSSSASPQDACGKTIGLGEWIPVVNIEVPFKKKKILNSDLLIWSTTKPSHQGDKWYQYGMVSDSGHLWLHPICQTLVFPPNIQSTQTSLYMFMHVKGSPHLQSCITISCQIIEKWIWLLSLALSRMLLNDIEVSITKQTKVITKWKLTRR